MVKRIGLGLKTSTKKVWTQKTMCERVIENKMTEKGQFRQMSLHRLDQGGRKSADLPRTPIIIPLAGRIRVRRTKVMVKGRKK